MKQLILLFRFFSKETDSSFSETTVLLDKNERISETQHSVRISGSIHGDKGENHKESDFQGLPESFPRWFYSDGKTILEEKSKMWQYG